jgi:hypothetical protein
MWRWLAAAVLLLLAMGCAQAPDRGAPSPDPAGPGEVPVVDWSALQGMEPIDVNGYTLEDCDPGFAPLLCVMEDGGYLGSIELTVGVNDDLMTSLDDVAADYRSTFEEDRAAGCPEGYKVIFEKPARLTVAGGPGIRVDFSVFDGDERRVERVVNYFALDGQRRIALGPSGLAEEGACLERLGPEFDPEAMDDLLPLFDSVAAGSVIPEEWEG